MQISLTCSEGWKVNFIYVFFSVDLVLPSLFVLSVTTAHKLSQQLRQGCFQREVSGSSMAVELDPQTDEKSLCFNQFLSTCGAISGCFQESNGSSKVQVHFSQKSVLCPGCKRLLDMRAHAEHSLRCDPEKHFEMGAIGSHWCTL